MKAEHVPQNPDPSVPEDVAVDVALAMQSGDVNRWLSCWKPSERPAMSQADAQSLPKSWHISHDSTITIRGRIVTGTDVVVELALADGNSTQQKLMIPLTKENDRWWLTSIDPQSESLHWEDSPNKVVDHCDSAALRRRLNWLNQ